MGNARESLEYVKDSIYDATGSMYEALDGIDEAVADLDEVPESMNEGLESKVTKKQFTLIEFVILGGIISFLAGFSMPNLRKCWQDMAPKKEYVASYESARVRQLADSALRKAGPVERHARLYEMDKDKDEVITENEVLTYVRENSYKLR